MLVYAVTIFTGAFLLFAVQPLIGKFILPWFGGSSAVWTTVMLFFQVLLLAGYGYAHALISRFSARAQAIIHLAVIALAVAMLPITPDAGWKPTDGGEPTLRILGLLAASLGLQGMVVSTTGPLMQRWFSVARPGASPYRLYALSNLGSFLALLSYPVLIEPNLSRVRQAQIWSVGFCVYAAFAAACTVLAWRAATGRSASVERLPDEADPAPPTRGDRVLWLILPAVASVLLLAVTNQLTLDVAVIPFLWVVPLSIYLLTFILAFDRPAWYVRPLFAPLVPLGTGAILLLLYLSDKRSMTILIQVAIYGAVLFVVCMFLHGELVRRKPHPQWLTSFYLSIAAGGAAGGIFVALAAPFLFVGYFEMHLGLFLACFLVMVVYFRDAASRLRHGTPVWAWALFVAAFIGIGVALAINIQHFLGDAIYVSRGFYGVLSINEVDADIPATHRYTLAHGSTVHGLQFASEKKRRWATSYFGPDSGVGRAVRAFPSDQLLRIGTVGLGVGTIAAYGKKGDVMRFYEINPEVIRLARERFTYLSDSPATIETVLGDARISMEREEPQNYDLLNLDAFSGDSIPVHLLTREAFEIYARHLKPDGILAIHLSNAYLDLPPVAYKLADHFGLGSVLIEDYRKGDREENEALLADEDRRKGLYTSTWVLVSADPNRLAAKSILDGEVSKGTPPRGLRLWTDDDTSLFPILDY